MKLHVYALPGEVCWPRLLPVGAEAVVSVTWLGEGGNLVRGKRGESEREPSRSQKHPEEPGSSRSED